MNHIVSYSFYAASISISITVWLAITRNKKTFLHKVLRSLQAMLCGWVACNLVFAAWMGLCPTPGGWRTLSSWLDEFKFIGLCTGLVIGIAWLTIFLPIDLYVSDDSKLRRPNTAALFGFFVSFSIVAFFFLFGLLSNWEEVRQRSVVDLIPHLDSKALTYILGTCMTGTVAGYIRGYMDRRSF
ncbi:MAG: hypothetical protein RLZZ399_1811 [Verrucomicrobiota bacterium]|jgi:hypothetical protein